MDKTLNLEDFGQALRRRRKTLNLTLEALAQTTGISKPYLSNIETARTPGPPSAEKLALIAAALQLDGPQLLHQADWLRTPISIRNLLPAKPPRRPDGSINLDAMLHAFNDTEPPASLATTTDQTFAPEDLQTLPLARIPLINRVAAGKLSEFTDLDYPVGVADAYIPVPALPDETVAGLGMFALRITGDSMEPLYPHGDIVVFSAHQVPRDGDDCLVRLDADKNFSTTFKRVYFSVAEDADATAQVRLMPLNPKHSQITIARERITGIFPALWRISPAHRSQNDSTVLKPKKHAKRPPSAKPPPENSPKPTPAPEATSKMAIEFD